MLGLVTVMRLREQTENVFRVKVLDSCYFPDSMKHYRAVVEWQ